MTTRSTAYRFAAAFLVAAVVPAAVDAQSTRRVWAGPEFDQLGGPSPDGRLLTFVDWTSGDVAVADLRTQAKRRLTARGTFAEPGAFRNNRQEFALFSRFSPSGQNVAFTWYTIDISDVARTGTAAVTVELRLVDTAASESRLLFSVRGERGYVEPVDWSRDGQNVVTTGTAEDGTGRIQIVPLTGSARIIKSFPDWRTPSTAKLSPDGAYLAYDYQPKKTDSRRNIYLLPLRGGSETVLVDDVQDAALVGWAPDGSHILFWSERGGTPGLWGLAVNAGRRQDEPRLVKKDMWRSAPVGLTPDGKYYYSVQGGDQDIYIATYDGSGKLQSRPIAVTGQAGQQFHTSPRWSADGKYLAYVTTGRGNQLVGGTTLTVYSVDARERQQLRPPVSYLQAALWMPGGRALALRARDDQGRNALLELDLGTGDISPIVSFQTNEAGLPPAFSPDGGWLYYSPAQTRDQPRRRIVARELKTGAERDLYVAPQESSRSSPGGSPMYVSPDGRWLAVAMHTDTAGLRRVVLIPTAGGLPRVLAGKSPDGQPVSRIAGFSGDSRHVFYSTAAGPSTNKQSALWRLSIDGAVSERLEVPAKDFRFPTISPDGRRLAYGTGELAPELWVLEDVTAGLRSAKSGSSRR